MESGIVLTFCLIADNTLQQWIWSCGELLVVDGKVLSEEEVEVVGVGRWQATSLWKHGSFHSGRACTSFPAAVATVSHCSFTQDRAMPLPG